QTISAYTDIVNYINGDTTDTGARKNTSYVLYKDSLYFALGTIQNNYNLSITAGGSGSAKPQILILTDESGNNAKLCVPHGNLNLEGIFISGVDNSGKQLGDLIETGTTNIRISLKNCTIDSVKNRIVIDDQDSCSVFFEDCYISNIANSSHGGRVLDARETVIDSVSFINNTFYNIMHDIIGRFSGGEKYFKFDHNTIYNLMRCPLRIDVCPDIIVTNNLFIQTGFVGYLTSWEPFISALDMGDRDEWTRVEIWPLDSSAAFTGYTQSINFKNNNFWMDPAIIAQYPDTVHAYRTLDFDFEKQMVGTDTTTWLSEDVSFTSTPTCKYIEMAIENWKDGSPQTNPGWTDNTRPYYFTYPTTKASYTAATGGFPLGDLNWWPEKKAQWILTDVKSVSGATLPAKYAIEQNFPNPFNPTTIIKYSIPKESLVKIKIYNVLGKEVATLVNSNQKAGEYNITFNAAKMASGVYFYNISAGNFNSTKKMILMK
ncbi:MAG: T9SS type A sorting domain-containing protein, partial [Ignavibacteriaceae bacterium]|nr:T9SS type A sorting domain-containing protein [Ignavibacteriaceae bacterium]